MHRLRKPNSYVFTEVWKRWIWDDLVENNKNLLLWIVEKDMWLSPSINSDIKWANEFKTWMESIYNWANLWETQPMLSEWISGKELPNQFWKIFVYRLPNELEPVLEWVSSQIWELAFESRSYWENISYVPYNSDNLHISITQWWFIDDKFDDNIVNEFHKIFEWIKFNNVEVEFDWIWLSRDSIVIKFKPKFPLKHVCNQIKSMLLDKNSLTKQWWGLNCTIWRFVWVSNDPILLSKISKIVNELADDLKWKSFKLSEFQTKILNHCFSLVWKSYFKLI